MRAGVLAILAGVLVLLTGGASSTLLFDEIGGLVEDRWPDSSPVVEPILKGLSFLAALGGLAIIVGGIVMLVGLEGIGRIVVWVSAIMALVGWVLLGLIILDRGEGSGSWGTDLAFWLNLLGIVLAFRAKP